MDDEIRSAEDGDPASAEQNRSLDEKKTDGDFAARYQSAKEQDVARLSKEIEERKSAEDSAKHRKWWIKTVLLLVLIGASIALLFGVTSLIEGESIKSFHKMVAGINWVWFGILLGMVALYILFESSKYLYLLWISTGKLHFKASIKVMFIGKYYDGITPLGSGGQPFQIYYLHKKNSIPAGVATAVPLVKFTVTTVVYCLLAAVLFILAPGYLPGGWGDTTLLIIAWISMTINFFIPVAIIVVSLFPRFGKKCVVWLVNVLSKLRVVKHKYPTMRKYVYEIEEYRASLKAILRSWWNFIPLVILSLIVAVVSNSIPFCAVVAIADITPTFDLYIQMLGLSLISFYSSSLVPTPGNSGALEGAASIIFATVLMAQPGVKGVIGWVILAWRLFTYYIYIFSGIGINIFEIIRSAVRNRRARKAAPPSAPAE